MASIATSLFQIDPISRQCGLKLGVDGKFFFHYHQITIKIESKEINIIHNFSVKYEGLQNSEVQLTNDLSKI
jgi:hypothetical protein